MDHLMPNYVATANLKSNRVNLIFRKIQLTWLQWTAEHKCFRMKHYYKEVCNFN